MAAPTFVNVGTGDAGTGAINPGVPANIQGGDILICFVQTGNNFANTPINSGGNAAWQAGIWTQLSDSPVYGTIAEGTAGANRAAVFWMRFTSSMTAGTVGIADSGNHAVGIIGAYRGCIATGDPIDGSNTRCGYYETASSAPNCYNNLGIRTATTVNDTLAILFFVNSRDSTGSNFNSISYNGLFPSAQKRAEVNSNAGTGGTILLWDATKTTAGNLIDSSPGNPIIINFNSTVPTCAAFLFALKPAVSTTDGEFTVNCTSTVSANSGATDKVEANTTATSATNIAPAWYDARVVSLNNTSTAQADGQDANATQTIEADANTQGTSATNIAGATILGVIMGGAGGAAAAQITQDTQNGDSNVGNNAANTAKGQSFTTVGGFTLERIDVAMKKMSSPTDGLYVEIASGSIDGTTIATSDTVPVAYIPANVVHVSFLFPTKPQLSPTTQYFFRVYRTGSLDAVNYYALGVQTSNPYADGTQWTYNGSTWSESATNDLRFIVYSEAKLVQNSGTVTGALGNTATNTARGQSFTTVGAFSLAQIELRFARNNSPSDNLYLELATAIDGATIATSDSVAGSTLVSSGLGDWVHFVFSNPPSLAATTQYFIRIFRSGAVDASNYYQAYVDNANPYAGGTWWTWNGTTWSQGGTIDARFIIYSAAAAAGVAGTSTAQANGTTILARAVTLDNTSTAQANGTTILARAVTLDNTSTAASDSGATKLVDATATATSTAQADGEDIGGGTTIIEADANTSGTSATTIIGAALWSSIASATGVARTAQYFAGSTYNSDGSVANIQSIHDNQAQDGDIITLPAGTFEWTGGLTITKGVMLRGQTTTDSVAGTANDQTIIVDKVVRQAGGVPIIRITSTLGKAYRISGLTFQGGSMGSQNNNGAIVLNGNSHSVRLDHCHFHPSLSAPQQALFIAVAGAIWGVADHNVIEITSGQSITFHMDNWPNPNGSDGVYGDGSWATPTNFGSEAFFFVEDNYVDNQSSPFSELTGNTDDTRGGRWVWRYNHCYDIEMQTHGTEIGRYRGGRAREIYNNDFHNAHAHATGGIRSGVTISHDNTFDGTEPIKGIVLETYRAFNAYVSIWGGGSGDNGWDVNDVTNGQFSENGFTYNPVNGLYESGTASGGSTTELVDTSQTWDTNMWAGFVAKRVSDGKISFIQSNTNDTLTVYFFGNSGSANSPTWAQNDQYEIRRPNILVDQCGRGDGDLVTGDNPTPAWPNQQLEPSYCWDDTYTPNSSNVVFEIGIGNTRLQQAERDYYNNTAMPGYAPFVYPHPLTSDEVGFTTGKIAGVEATTTGSSTVTGNGEAIWAVGGSAAGTSTVTGNGDAIWRVDATATGTSTVSGHGADAAATGSDANTAGTSTANADSGAIKGTEATSEVTSTTTINTAYRVSSNASASGGSTVSGVLCAFQSVSVSVSGVGTLDGISAKIAGIVGTALGSCVVIGEGVNAAGAETWVFYAGQVAGSTLTVTLTNSDLAGNVAESSLSAPSTASDLAGVTTESDLIGLTTESDLKVYLAGLQ